MPCLSWFFFLTLVLQRSAEFQFQPPVSLEGGGGERESSCCSITQEARQTGRRRRRTRTRTRTRERDTLVRKLKKETSTQKRENIYNANSEVDSDDKDARPICTLTADIARK